MRRRFVYAGAGSLLSAGAPLGLLAVRLTCPEPGGRPMSLRRVIRDAARDPRDYIYVGASTSIVLTIFGYVLGRHADRLAELSETDPLTGLLNARGLFNRLDAELVRLRRYRHPLALLLVDLDGLKDINDRFGHRAGDEAIGTLAGVIRSELRKVDVGARWGGDEFAILAPNTSSTAAVALAERIRTSIAQQGREWRLSGSLGVATVDPQAGREVVDSATLMRAADVALYEAKRTGRNRVVVASPELDGGSRTGGG